jgi:hypothetical protein
MLGFLFLTGYLAGCAFFLDFLFKKELLDSKLQGKS